MLVNVPRLITAYFSRRPDVARPGQEISFGTSGHRGSSFKSSFNEAHILAKLTRAPANQAAFEILDGYRVFLPAVLR